MTLPNNFTKLELETLIAFLKDLEHHYSIAGCNDFDIPNTPEGRAMYIAAVRFGMSEEDATEDLAHTFEHSKDRIYTFDTLILSYLKHKIELMLQQVSEK